jgi:hypothetical protein
MKIVEYDRLARTACRGRSAEVDRLTDVSDLPVWHTTGIIIRTQGSPDSFVSLCGTLHQTFDTSLSCITPFTKCSCPSRAVHLRMRLQKQVFTISLPCQEVFPSTPHNHAQACTKSVPSVKHCFLSRVDTCDNCPELARHSAISLHRCSYPPTMISQSMPEGCRGPRKLETV